MNTYKMSVAISVILIVITMVFLRRNNIEQQSTSHNRQASKKTAQFYANGCPMYDHQEWMVWKATQCEKSPDGILIGKFIYNSYYDSDRYYELFVMTSDGNKEWKIFSGDYKTLGWHWKTDTKIQIDWNCGSGCRASKDLEINDYLSIAHYKTEGGMSKKNGWSVTFAQSF